MPGDREELLVLPYQVQEQVFPHMRDSSKLKAKELRKKTDKELFSMLSEIDKELGRWRSWQHNQNVQGRPSSDKGQVRFGLFQTMKKNKAIILTVLTEKGIRRR